MRRPVETGGVEEKSCFKVKKHLIQYLRWPRNIIFGTILFMKKLEKQEQQVQQVQQEEKPDPLMPFRDEAKRILKSEMERRGVSGKHLAALIGESDATDGQGRAVINKLNKGAFSFAWVIRALRAMGVTTLDLRPVEGPAKPVPPPKATASSADSAK